MKDFKVKIISRDVIKPSSPTPHLRRYYKLSLLDQLAPPFYIPLLLFYAKANDEHHIDKTISDQLKSSLSHTLTHFYPLAGRLIIKDRHIVNCNDEGVEFAEALVNGMLSHVFLLRDEQPDDHFDLLNHFLPFDAYTTLSSEQLPITSVQVNFFACGGIAIGACVSHKIADGAAVAMFLNAWASALCSASTEAMVLPWLSSAAMFPPKDHLLSMLSSTVTGPTMTENKKLVITRRLLFDVPKLAALRTQLIIKNGVSPTRIEAVTALIWKCAKNVSRVTKSRPTIRLSVATHVVNLRRKIPMVPPPSILPENSFGNLWCSAVAEATSTEEIADDELHSLVSELRHAIRKIDGDYVRRLQFDADSLMGYNNLKEVREKRANCEGEIQYYRFSSWCNFPFYQTDFGWGKPIWVSTTRVPFENIVILISTRDGQGIEALVNLAEEDMKEFLDNKELLKFVSLVY